EAMPLLLDDELVPALRELLVLRQALLALAFFEVERLVRQRESFLDLRLNLRQPGSPRLLRLILRSSHRVDQRAAVVPVHNQRLIGDVLLVKAETGYARATRPLAKVAVRLPQPVREHPH